MKQRSFLVLSFSLFVSLVPARAQQDTLYNENVIVTGTYKPEIEFMPKVLVAPTVADTLIPLRHNFEYPLRPERLTALFDPSRIKAARIIAEPKSKLYHNYLRLGMGNYWSPLLEYSFNSTADRRFIYGAQLSHHSSWGSIGDKDTPEKYYGGNHYSQTGVDLFGRYNLSCRHQLYGSLHYDNDFNTFYGYSDTTLSRYENNRHGLPANYEADWRDSIKNTYLGSVYNYLRFCGGFHSLPNSRSPWNYDAHLSVADLIGSQGHNELGIELGGTVSRSLDLRNIKEIQSPSIALRLNWYQYRHALDLQHLPIGYTPSATEVTNETRNRTLVNINPYATMKLAMMNVHLGATLSINQYTKPKDPQAYLLPDITVSRHFADESLSLTLGAQGTNTPNTWNEMRLANPWALGTDDVRSMRHYTYYLAAHYKFVKRLHLNAKVSYNLYHDFMTYELDSRFSLNNVFRPKYESFSQMVVSADLTFVNDEMISITLGGDYYKGAGLDEDPLPGLYHPAFDIHLVTHVNYNDQWIIHFQALLLDKMNAAYAYDATAMKYKITETVPLRYNFNAEVEYRHNRALSFFLRLENIACQRYQYWLNYPSQKLRCTLGATYTF